MSVYHVVGQGEHISGIARRYGFTDYRTIWNHPQNAELKQKRQNPHVLYPGDEVYIPERQAEEFNKPSDQRHRFRIDASTLFLHLKLERAYDKAIANTKCDLIAGSDLKKLTTDGGGELKEKISEDLVEATLIIKDTIEVKEKKIPLDIELPIKVGYLDPVETPTGQLARLINLGYYRGPSAKPDEKELLSAVEEFQCDNNLTVDGVCGPKTQAKLKEVHGC